LFSDNWIKRWTKILGEPIPQSGLEILKDLARNEPSHKSLIRDRCSLGYATVHENVSKLLGLQLIEVVDEETWRTGLKKLTYDLTLKGLLWVFFHSSFGEISRKIDRLSRKYANLAPLVFGKWDFFRKMELEDQAIRRLFYARTLHHDATSGAMISLPMELTEEEKKEWKKRATEEYEEMMQFGWPIGYSEKHVRIMFTEQFHLPSHLETIFYPFKKEEVQTWLNSMIKDEELKIYVRVLLKRAKSTLQKQLKEIEKQLTFMTNIFETV